jgi:TPP-dependent pyruvate/acetoin dehydrogenase alpha subunit
MEHWGPGTDWDLGYRTKDEGDQWKRLCPIKKQLEVLKERHEDGLVRKMIEEINLEIQEAIDFAISNIDPTPEELLTEEGYNA